MCPFCEKFHNLRPDQGFAGALNDMPPCNKSQGGLSRYSERVNEVNYDTGLAVGSGVMIHAELDLAFDADG